MSKDIQFRKPPVVETLFSLQFEALENFKNYHVGLLYEKYKTDFEEISEVPPIQPHQESFEKGPVKINPFSLELFDTPPMPRYWFKDKDSTNLLQIQQDRFIQNWKELGSRYPKYPQRISEFKTNLLNFIAFLEENNLGAFKPNQCEFTYINHIHFDGLSHSHLEEIVNIFHTNFVDFEEATIKVASLITDNSDKKPIARLFTVIEPKYLKSTETEIYQIIMSARGNPLREDLDGVIGFFDRVRDPIKETFRNITTSKMHDLWELEP